MRTLKHYELESLTYAVIALTYFMAVLTMCLAYRNIVLTAAMHRILDIVTVLGLVMVACVTLLVLMPQQGPYTPNLLIFEAVLIVPALLVIGVGERKESGPEQIHLFRSILKVVVVLITLAAFGLFLITGPVGTWYFFFIGFIYFLLDWPILLVLAILILIGIMASYARRQIEPAEKISMPKTTLTLAAVGGCTLLIYFLASLYSVGD